MFKLFIALICISLLSLVIFGIKSARDLQIEHITLNQSDLPEAKGLRIAFISDIHMDSDMLFKARHEMKKQHPHLIILGGDLINAGEVLGKTRQFISILKGFSKIAPCYAVLGNHDMADVQEVERMYKIAGITLLRNQALPFLCPNGSRIQIVGMGDWNEYDENPQSCLKRQNKEDAESTLLISHDPESRAIVDNYQWKLMLCGHTHGGQISNPITGEYISFQSTMPSGLYDGGKGRKIYVTRGLASTFGMRFFCPPELSIIDIGEQ